MLRRRNGYLSTFVRERHPARLMSRAQTSATRATVVVRFGISTSLMSDSGSVGQGSSVRRLPIWPCRSVLRAIHARLLSPRTHHRSRDLGRTGLAAGSAKLL